MKRLVLIAVLIVVGCKSTNPPLPWEKKAIAFGGGPSGALGGGPAPVESVTISWDYIPSSITPDTVFEVWTGTAPKLSSFTIAEVIPAWPATNTYSTVWLNDFLPSRFFSVTASNYNGRSDYATK